MTKLSDYLDKKKIDPRRVLVASKKLERLHPADRAVRLAKTRTRGGKPSDAEKALAETKPKSGKPVSRPLLDAALRGDKISGPSKTRLVRAVNAVVSQKKGQEVSLSDLF